jgi:hypothetical protein
MNPQTWRFPQIQALQKKLLKVMYSLKRTSLLSGFKICEICPIGLTFHEADNENTTNNVEPRGSLFQNDHDPIAPGDIVSSSTVAPAETHRGADSELVIEPSNRGAETFTESGAASRPRRDALLVTTTGPLGRGREHPLPQAIGIRPSNSWIARPAEEITPPQTPEIGLETIVVGIDIGLTHTGTYADDPNSDGERTTGE